MSTSLKRRDYSKYVWRKKEFIFAIVKSAAVVMFLACFFYRSLWAALPLAVLGVFYFRMQKRNKIENYRRELELQFKECILSVSISLRAGYAVENAFLESRKDMRLLFGGQSPIYQELEIIRRGLVINVTLEEMLGDLAKRSDSGEIRQFAEIFAIAKRNGGSLPEIIHSSSEIIARKMDTMQEIQTLLSGRQMEQKIMKAMPFGILLYIGVSYPGYFDMLYHNWQGAIIMTVCLIIYLLAYVLSDRILEGIMAEQKVKGKKPEKSSPGIMGVFYPVATFLYQRARVCKLPIVNSRQVEWDLRALYPGVETEQLCKKYYVGKISLSLLLCVTGTLLGVVISFREQTQGTGSAFIIGAVVLSVLLFVMADKDLHDELVARREAMKRKYPDVVQKLLLYLGAGMTVRGALGRMAGEYEEIGYLCRELQTGVSEAAAYENFGRRMGVQEYLRLSTMLAQNLKRGNSTLLQRLREEADRASVECLQSCRKLGEEAATKLLVPMVLLLLVVMLMIMIPAFSAMGV